MLGHVASPLQQLSGLQEKQKVARRSVQGSTVLFCFAEGMLCLGSHPAARPAPVGSGTAEAGLSPSPALRLLAQLILPAAASISFDGVHRAHAAMASCCRSKRLGFVVFFPPKR